jgi:hypothetical protein
MPGKLMSMMIASGWRARARSIPISAVGAVKSSISSMVLTRSLMKVTFAGLSST